MVTLALDDEAFQHFIIEIMEEDEDSSAKLFFEFIGAEMIEYMHRGVFVNRPVLAAQFTAYAADLATDSQAVGDD